MEFEDHYVTCSLKHTMEHWLWCAVLLIEVPINIWYAFLISLKGVKYHVSLMFLIFITPTYICSGHAVA
jgi:hypothetical protein